MGETLLSYCADKEILTKTKEEFVQDFGDDEPIFIRIRGRDSAGEENNVNTKVTDADNESKDLSPALMFVYPVKKTKYTDYMGMFKRAITIGRAKTSDICLKNKYISRLHAMIMKRQEEYRIKDANPTHKTQLIHNYREPEETRNELDKMEETALEDGVVVEFASGSMCDRLRFFSDPESIYDFVHDVMKENGIK